MPSGDWGVGMARLSKTGSKASQAKGRTESQTKGRMIVRTKRRAAPEAKVGKRLSVSELEAQLQRPTIELNEALERQAAHGLPGTRQDDGVRTVQRVHPGNVGYGLPVRIQQR